MNTVGFPECRAAAAAAELANLVYVALWETPAGVGVLPVGSQTPAGPFSARRWLRTCTDVQEVDYRSQVGGERQEVEHVGQS